MNILTDLRTDRGYSMKTLGEKAKVTQTTIYRIEHGQKASLLTLKKLAKALEVELSELAQLSDGADEPMQSRTIPTDKSSTYNPDPSELADLLEVVARSQHDGPGARVSLAQATAIIEKQISDFKNNRQLQNQDKQKEHRQSASA